VLAMSSPLTTTARSIANEYCRPWVFFEPPRNRSSRSSRSEWRPANGSCAARGPLGEAHDEDSSATTRFGTRRGRLAGGSHGGWLP